MPASVEAATRTPVQACAIIHAVFVAKDAAADFAASRQYCRKYLPSKPEANEKLHTKLSVSTAKRRSALGISANNRVARLGGRTVCDPDIVNTFPKEADPAVLLPGVETLLNDALALCNERQ